MILCLLGDKINPGLGLKIFLGFSVLVTLIGGIV